MCAVLSVMRHRVMIGYSGSSATSLARLFGWRVCALYRLARMNHVNRLCGRGGDNSPSHYCQPHLQCGCAGQVTSGMCPGGVAPNLLHVGR